jgi:hypothetical protein
LHCQGFVKVKWFASSGYLSDNAKYQRVATIIKMTR